MKGSAVALFSVNPMYSVNFMSVKVMLHCIYFRVISIKKILFIFISKGQKKIKIMRVESMVLSNYSQN